MPAYEPKTDSKEFEIPDPGQEIPRKEPAGESAAITIRVWNPERLGASASLSWKTESVLVYMIADLVTASQGHVDESSATMTAHFDDAGRALVAARRIQIATLEFVTCRCDTVAVAILIHVPATIPGGLSAGMAQGALRLAEPGQILLSEEAMRNLHEIPGIELRPVAALASGGDGQTGLTELVWASADQIAKLKASLGSPQDREQGSLMGATMIVNAPLTAQPGDTTGLSPQQTATAKISSATGLSGDVLTGRDAPYEELIEAEQPFLTRTKVIVGLVAVALVAASVWMFYPSRAAKQRVRVPETEAGTAGSSNPAGPSAPPALTAQPPTSEPPKPVVATKPTPPAKSVEKRAKEKPPAAVSAPNAQEPQPPQSVEGMTAKDIPNLLQMARTDAGSGNYDKARREYRIVLELQPNNAEAREGLRRVDVAESDR